MQKQQMVYTSTSYCTQHRGGAPIKGGDYITSNNGMSKRWLCAGCIENRKRREENASLNRR